MASIRCLLVFIVLNAANSLVDSHLAAAAAQTTLRYEPMVAFTCSLPAMHMADGQTWKRDEHTDCLSKPEDILAYCRKQYPSLDIRSIVEASAEVTIKDWCPAKQASCHHRSYTVRPYRCLVGPFQSDALVVPNSCLFDQLRNSNNLCQTYHEWNLSTSAACVAHNMVQHSFAILQPCAISRFAGAEFVCCPVVADATQNEDDEDDDDDDDDDDEDYNEDDDEKFDKISSIPVTETTTTSSVHKSSTVTAPAKPRKTATTSSKSLVSDAYAKNLEQGDLDKNNNKSEHDAYKRARLDLQNRHHQKVAKMMKEWAAARQRVQEMKLIDAKGAAKLNRQITARFQKMYESLTKEREAETKQLNAIHLQRVQAELNEQKREAMETYMEALGEEQPSAVRIVKALKQYIKAEQKDRAHTISHYRRVQQLDTIEAEAIFSYVADHLRVIDERLTQALDMLHRLPKLEKKIRQHVDEFLGFYQSLNDESMDMILTERWKAESTTSTTNVVSSTETPGNSLSFDTSTTNKETKASLDNWTTTRNTDGTAKTQAITAKPKIEARAMIDRIGPPFDFESSFDRLDDGVMESRDDYVHLGSVGHVAHMDNSQFDQVQMSGMKKWSIGSADSARGGYLQATPLGIAACSVALIVIIIVGSVLLHRRARLAETFPLHEVPVSNPTTAEPPKISSPPPMNGYENPTHKYLERTGMEA